jgi:hypothetical protein
MPFKIPLALLKLNDFPILINLIPSEERFIGKSLNEKLTFLESMTKNTLTAKLLLQENMTT